MRGGLGGEDVSFFLPSDQAYLSAKSLKQGVSRLDAIYDGFVARFSDTFGYSPLAIGVDTIERPNRAGSRPRLGIVLERTAQCLAFNESPEPFANYDPSKQRETAALFVDEMHDIDLRRLFDMPRRTPRTFPWRDEIFVYFSDFERTAKWELNDLVVGAGLDEWVESLGLRDQFWCTERFAGPPIVFVYTDEQATALRESPLPKSWGDGYFALASRFDEFGYLTRDDVVIEVDSKENFDANYASNWYYYFK